MDLKEIVLSRLYDGSWTDAAKTENQRNFLKIRRRLNRNFAARYGENNGYEGWWIDGFEVWRADMGGRESALLSLHLKKQEEKENILFYGVEDLRLKGDLQPPKSKWAAEVLLMAFEEQGKKLYCAIVCREGFTLKMRFSQVVPADRQEEA